MAGGHSNESDGARDDVDETRSLLRVCESFLN